MNRPFWHVISTHFFSILSSFKNHNLDSGKNNISKRLIPLFNYVFQENIFPLYWINNGLYYGNNEEELDYYSRWPVQCEANLDRALSSIDGLTKRVEEERKRFLESCRLYELLMKTPSKQFFTKKYFSYTTGIMHDMRKPYSLDRGVDNEAYILLDKIKAEIKKSSDWQEKCKARKQHRLALFNKQINTHIQAKKRLKEKFVAY